MTTADSVPSLLELVRLVYRGHSLVSEGIEWEFRRTLSAHEPLSRRGLGVVPKEGVEPS